jgi:flagellar basal body rod protein FlgG
MKKNVLTLLLLLVAMMAQAADYPYLTFEMTDGQKTSVSVTTLSISIADGKLTVGGQTFDLSSLSKMYFSTASETTDISVVKNSQLTIDDDAEIYDLQGRRLSKDQMRHGIYVVKTKNGTFKVSMK